MEHYQSICGQVGHQLKAFQLFVEGEGDEELRGKYGPILARRAQVI
jgi:hypothetical protein